ncbi:hypothetical protein HYC85_016770 [Camellia sinensis]|uniref:Uncharacterized protein n=1 Tax=Camellia sinensis TaxID=4442 RepID=A0A7J7H0K5_CAMSI|nr:hypothetical protein HYC85_016770 [Camellia sinensis]
MDDIGGEYINTGVYGDKLRLLILLNGFEVGFGDLTATTQLPIGGVGCRKGLRVVFRGVSLVFPFVGCHVHRCFHRIHKPNKIQASSGRGGTGTVSTAAADATLVSSVSDCDAG